MGFGGAFIMPATLAIIMNVFERDEQPEAIGIWTGVVGLGHRDRPDHRRRSARALLVGLGLPDQRADRGRRLVAMVLIVPDSKDPQAGRLDPVGVLLSIVGLVLLSTASSRAASSATSPTRGAGRRSSAAWRSSPASSGASAQRPPRARRHATSGTGASPPSVAAIGLVFFALMGVTFFIVFYTQCVRGYSALQSGLLLLPLAVAQMFFAPRARLVVDRFGARAVCAAGLVLTAVSFLGFLLLGQDTPIWVLEVLFFLMGAAMAHVMPPATVMIMSSLPREKAGSGSAVNNTFRQVGGALGVAVLGSLLSTVYRDGIAGHLGVLSRPPPRHAAGESIEATLGVAGKLGPAGQALVQPGQRRLHPRHARHRAGLGGRRPGRRGRGAALPARAAGAPGAVRRRSAPSCRRWVPGGDRTAGRRSARRGRPRNAAVDRAVIETVLRLISDGASFGELSMEGIAREAGVGKATVYRRWPARTRC